jgi:hypothetical protein
MVGGCDNAVSTGERLTDRISIGVLARAIPRDLVDDVLAETGRREKRRRRLPAHVVVYFVVAMAIFRDSYEEVLRKLVNGLRSWGTGVIIGRCRRRERSHKPGNV